MLRTTFSRTVLGVVIAAAVLVPAASADDWARNGLDPAIATALQDKVAQLPESVPLDTAIAVALRDRGTSEQVALDPAIQAALLDHASPAQPIQDATVGGFGWNNVGIGASAAFAALLLALGSLLALRQRRTGVTSA